jgi:hypothetical protein
MFCLAIALCHFPAPLSVQDNLLHKLTRRSTFPGHLVTLF